MSDNQPIVPVTSNPVPSAIAAAPSARGVKALALKGLPYLICFLVGIAIAISFTLGRTVVVPKIDPIAQKDLKAAQEKVTQLEKQLEDLKKHGADKKDTDDPLNYWKNN